MRIIVSLTGRSFTGTKIDKLESSSAYRIPFPSEFNQPHKYIELVSNTDKCKRYCDDNTGDYVSADSFLKMEFNEWHFWEVSSYWDNGLGLHINH